MSAVARAFCWAVVALALVAPAAARAGVFTGVSGWAWSSPSPTGANITAVEFSGSTGYAAGPEGDLLRSDDGGATWRGLPGGPVRQYSPSEVAVPAPESVIVAGSDCALRRSDDGGRSFRRLRIVPSGTVCPAKVSSFAAPSVRVLHVGLVNGAVYSSADGGATFLRRRPIVTSAGGATRSLAELVFSSPDRGFAVTADLAGRHILRTADGGASWSVVATGARLSGLQLTPEGVGYAHDGPRTVLRSGDGGATWAPVALAGLGPDAVIGQAACPNADTCVFRTTRGFSDRAEGMRTTDGGRTVSKVASLAEADGVLAAVSSSRVAMLGGGSQAISDDGGATFTRLGSRLDAGPAAALTRTGRSSAIAVGDLGNLARTMDAGRTWQAITLPSSFRAAGAWFASPSIGYAFDGQGALIRTVDGAQSWREVLRQRGDPGVQPGISGVYAPDRTRVLVFGKPGIKRSLDGGRTFAKVRSRALRGLSFLRFDIARKAIFASTSTAIVRSLDGGRTWKRVRHPRKFVFHTDFLTATRGYAGDDEDIFRTSDGGRHWRRLRPGIGELRGFAFASLRTGWAWSFGVLLRTDDAGRTWRPQPLARSLPTPAGIVAFTSSTAAAVSRSSLTFAAYLTTSGGDARGASKITLRASRTRVRRGTLVRLSGRITPGLEGEPISIPFTANGGILYKDAVTGRGGRFALRFTPGRSADVFARWAGDGISRGAGTPPLRIAVLGKRR